MNCKGIIIFPCCKDWLNIYPFELRRNFFPFAGILIILGFLKADEFFRSNHFRINLFYFFPADLI